MPPESSVQSSVGQQTRMFSGGECSRAPAESGPTSTATSSRQPIQPSSNRFDTEISQERFPTAHSFEEKYVAGIQFVMKWGPWTVNRYPEKTIKAQ